MPVVSVFRTAWLPVTITSQTLSLWFRLAKAIVASTTMNALSLLRRQISLWQASHAHLSVLRAVAVETKNLCANIPISRK